MNKGELVDAIALITDQKKVDINLTVSALFDVIAHTLGDGEKVTIVGFGTFEPRERKEREGRNPQPGEKMTITAIKVPVFIPGKVFKEKTAS